MKKIIATLLLSVALFSCKSKQAVVSEGAAEGGKSVKEIAAGHYKNIKDYSTIAINANTQYEDSEGQSLSFTTDIRIKKDEMILVSGSILGVTVTKALITPQRVSYYVKFENVYFDGDYEALSRFLGTDLNYDKVQNMLLGEAMDNLEKGNYKVTLQDGMYRLQGKADGGILKDFLFEGANYLLKQQQISQGGDEPRSLAIEYPAYKEQEKGTLPTGLKIKAEDKKKVNIDVDYKNITFDKAGLKFNYSIPDGYKQITID
jgi:hypothetical protein